MPHTITVIIPTNRGGPFLRTAVQSVRDQTTPVTEIILVDDGAPGVELERFASDHGLRYLRLEGRGVSAARNAGAEAAEGDWLVFLDDDDIWHPERIASQVQALEAQPHAIAGHTGGWYMDAEGTRFGTDWRARPVDALSMLRGEVPLPRITTVIVRRDIFTQIGGFDTGMRMGEDNDLMRRLLMRGEFVAVDRSLVGYRRHSGNVTARMLDGRRTARRSIRRLRAAARADGDVRNAEALDERWRRFLGEAAEENIAEFAAAFRRREWVYAIRIGCWGVFRLPWHSLRALLARGGRRRRAASAEPPG